MTGPVVSVLLLLVLAFGSYGVGSLLLRRIRGWQGVLEKAVFAVPLGMASVGYLLLVLGLLRQFHRPVFIGLLVLLGVAGLWFLRDLLTLRQTATVRIADAPPRPVAFTGGAALALIGACTLLAALAPPSSLEWDALSYHLAAPKVFLREGRVLFIPYDHHSNFPFTLQMLYTLMLGVGSEGGAKLCHWLCGALTVASVYTFATRHFALMGRGKTIGLLAALFVAATPMVIWEATVAYVDLATTLYTWLSLYALINAAQAVDTGGDGETDGLSVSWLLVSAVLMGFALGTKYTVIAYWGFLLLGILGWHYATTRRWAKQTLPHAALWGAVSLAVGAPWYVKNVLVTGNPVYPFAYGLFRGRYWNAENARLYEAAQADLGMAKTPVNLLLDPWQATMLPEAAEFTEYFVFALAPVFVALLLALPYLGRRLSHTSFWLLLFGAGAYAAWFFSVQQTRYLLAGLPPLALVCAEALLLLWSATHAARYAAATVAALTAAWGVYIAGGLAFWGVRDFQGNRVASPAWPVVSGQMSREEFIARRAPGYGAASLWINANTPPDAKVAIFDEVRGYYLDRPYAWAQPNHAAGLFPWDSYADADAWLADFKRRGYTTLLLGALDPNTPDDGQVWRPFLAEAVRGDKVVLAHEEPAGIAFVKQEGQDQPVPVRLIVKVYRIR